VITGNSFHIPEKFVVSEQNAGTILYFLKYHAMAIMIMAIRIIQELIVHVTMAEKSRMIRARAVRISSFEGDFMIPGCF